MTDPVQTPPGWYPSGVPGEERWWSGVDWTTHVRPTPSPAVADQRAPGTSWTGNKNGSLVGAIVCSAVAIPAALATLLALLSGTIMFLAPAFCTLVCIGLAVLLFLNYRGLSRNERATSAPRP